jgi:hypothetical protein
VAHRKPGDDRYAQGSEPFAQHAFDARSIGTRVARREASDDDGRRFREVARGDEVREHPIEAVGALADVFEQDDGSLRDAQARSGRARVQHREVAADERSFRAAGGPFGEPPPRALVLGALERRDPLSPRALARASERSHHGAVNRAEPAPPRLDVQDGEVGEPDEPARPFFDAAPVDQVCDARKTVAPTRRHHGADVGVECALELVDPPLVAAGEVTFAREERTPVLHAVALFEPGDAGLDRRPIERSGRRDDGDGVARAERRREDHLANIARRRKVAD